MYSLFIVDDEEIVRKGIRELLQNAESEYVICGEAPDGELALPMIQELKPDILLTDIRMPFMDGLDLCAMVRKKMPWIHILILSGHDEFEYAQKAVSLGVDEYILKPVIMLQLLEILASTAKKIEEERSLYFAAANDSRHDLLYHRFYNHLLDGGYTSAEALTHAEKLGINLSAREYVMCCIELHLTAANEALLQDQFSTLLEHLTKGWENTFWAARGDRFILIMKANEGNTVLDGAYETAQALTHETRRLLAAEISIGIGSVVSRISELPRSYQDAKRSLGGLNGSSHGLILGIKDLEQGLVPTFDFNEAVPLAEQLQYITAADIDLLLDNHFKSTTPDTQESLLYRYYLLADLMVSSMRLLQKNNAGKPSALYNASENRELMQAVSSHSQTLNYARKLLQTVIDQRDSTQSIRYGEEIKRAKIYIQKHFLDNELSLNTVAAQVGFSPNHFSTVFSQQTGQTFVEYLTRFRINESKRLLRETDLKLSDITYAIGYNEPHYFSYIFKKYNRISPSAYRKKYRPAEFPIE